mmetsp:Transcript_11016/g.24426  ORF Transcript_11016/g.24426 Transcript_11016/m.24426 type:complete len:200 (-) Transcript_11016:81-680(-)
MPGPGSTVSCELSLASPTISGIYRMAEATRRRAAASGSIGESAASTSAAERSGDASQVPSVLQDSRRANLSASGWPAPAFAALYEKQRPRASCIDDFSGARAGKVGAGRAWRSSRLCCQQPAVGCSRLAVAASARTLGFLLGIELAERLTPQNNLHTLIHAKMGGVLSYHILVIPPPAKRSTIKTGELAPLQRSSPLLN